MHFEVRASGIMYECGDEFHPKFGDGNGQGDGQEARTVISDGNGYGKGIGHSGEMDDDGWGDGDEYGDGYGDGEGERSEYILLCLMLMDRGTYRAF